MIRRNASGKLYCDGKYCGYPLAYFPGDEEELGEVVCLDCNSSMTTDKPNSAEDQQGAAQCAK